MPRNELIQVKVSAEEKEAIRAKASSLELHPSQYLRALGLQIELGTPRPAVEKELIAEALHAHDDKAERRKTAEQIIEESSVSDTPKNRQVAETIARADERKSWVDSTARILMMEKGLSKVAATMQASKDWEKR